MSSKDIEIAKMAAEAWRLNDERNQRIAAEKQKDAEERRRVSYIDDAPQE